MDNEFQFIIGEQYENYEFDVTFIRIIIEDNIEYVVYQYKKEEKHFLFDIEITEGVFLWFNADILMKVVYKFLSEEYKKLNQEKVRILERVGIYISF